jgi:hypothetical protein
LGHDFPALFINFQQAFFPAHIITPLLVCGEKGNLPRQAATAAGSVMIAGAVFIKPPKILNARFAAPQAAGRSSVLHDWSINPHHDRLRRRAAGAVFFSA